MQSTTAARPLTRGVSDSAMPQYIVFTDVDGSLLDGGRSSLEAAGPALRALRAHGIPLVLVSSKTRAEIEPLRRSLDHRGPFIVENGAAVFVPQGLFTFPLERVRSKSSYDVLELGLPYHMLRDVLKQIEDAVETPLRGFGDLSVDDIIEVTGLSHAQAELACMREYDEPFLFEGPQALVAEVCRQIVSRGLRWTKVGRLFHLSGDNDKGQAVELLMRCYQRERHLRFHTHPVESVGIGESIHDAPLLAVVNHPILLQRPDGSFDTDVVLPRLVRTRGMGAAGWNDAVLKLLQYSFSSGMDGMGVAV